MLMEWNCLDKNDPDDENFWVLKKKFLGFEMHFYGIFQIYFLLGLNRSL